MSDLWRRWDDEIATRGRPEVAASLLTDAELVNLLANDEDPHREYEKRLLRDEAYRRLQATRGPAVNGGHAEPRPGEQRDPF